MNFVITQYEKNGFEELNDISELLNMKFGNVAAVDEMGGVESVKDNFNKLQEVIYKN